MTILVIGSGGREHALVWKLWQSPHTTKVYCSPGNAGIGETAELLTFNARDNEALLRFAKGENIDLTVVGPEQPLVEGIVDMFEASSLKIFGPTRLAAELEGSKVFAKEFMRSHKIPTAEFFTFDQNRYDEARKCLYEMSYPLVLKADGLAAGKGVIICETKEHALQALDAMMREKIFGESGSKVVIEE